MKTEAVVKIESSLRKPGSNKANVNDALSTTKTTSLPAINGADSSRAIKKRVAPTKESAKKKQKSVPSAKKTILSAKKTVPSAKTSTDSDAAIKSLLSTKCPGCEEYPCTNIKEVLSVHRRLKQKYYRHPDGYAHDPDDGNSRRRKTFYYEYIKEVGGLDPCAQEFARIWFPRK
jgi:hypothetical protein